MARWLGAFVVAGCLGVAGWCPAEAKDHPVAKSLMRTGLDTLHGPVRATICPEIGTWLPSTPRIGSETHRLHICFLIKPFNTRIAAEPNRPTRSSPSPAIRTSCLRRCRWT